MPRSAVILPCIVSLSAADAGPVLAPQQAHPLRAVDAIRRSGHRIVTTDRYFN